MGVNFTAAMAISDVLIDLFNNAVSSIDIAAFYFTLTDGVWALFFLRIARGCVSDLACFTVTTPCVRRDHDTTTAAMRRAQCAL